MNPNNIQEDRKKPEEVEEITVVDVDNDVDEEHYDQNNEEINVVDIDDEVDGNHNNGTTMVTGYNNQHDEQSWFSQMMELFYHKLNNPRLNELQMSYTKEEDIWMESLKLSHVSVTSTLVPAYLFEVILKKSIFSSQKWCW